VRGRVARFLLAHDTKTGKNAPNEHKMYQMVVKYPKIFQMAIKYIIIFQSEAPNFFPKLGFLV
jgi:hypothetical protein